MKLLPRLFLAVLLPLAACAAPPRPIPHSEVVERPEPLPAGVKPLTVEQEEEVGGAT
jgi:hypothetical protein